MVVLDTSALLYWTLDPEKIPLATRKAIEREDRLIVSSISVWEIALKVKRGKLQIPLPLGEYVERLLRLEAVEIQPVDVQTWLDNLDLDWDHLDPADRTIVATAARLDCPLISSDSQIAHFYPRTIW
jgi:PIN domain nuclease of toxin-antitoxin system